VEGVVNPIIDFLSEEGFEWFKNKETSPGTYSPRSSSADNNPNVVSTRSEADRYTTKLEMWFVNKKTLVVGN
jgi:hypothetical protein